YSLFSLPPATLKVEAVHDRTRGSARLAEEGKRREATKGATPMRGTTLTGLCRVVVLTMAFGVCVWPASPARARGVGDDGGPPPGAESAEAEKSLTPFPFKLGGVLNPTFPQATSLATLTLTTGAYRQIYRFEVRTVEAPENPQLNAEQVLKDLDKYLIQLHLVGEKDLLTKIGQALPDTPLTINGLLTRGDRQLRILRVDGVSQEGRP